MAEASAGPEKDDSSDKEGKPRKRRRKKRSRHGRDHAKERANMIRAINHPLRRRILRLVGGRDEPLSPVQIAEELNVPLGTSTYHVRILVKLHALVLAGEAGQVVPHS